MTGSHWVNLGNGKVGKVHDIIEAMRLEPQNHFTAAKTSRFVAGGFVAEKQIQDFAEPLGNPVVSAPAYVTTSTMLIQLASSSCFLGHWCPCARIPRAPSRFYSAFGMTYP